MDESRFSLSPEGAARRAQMLAELQQALVRRRRLRRLRPVAALVVVGLVLGLWAALRPDRSPPVQVAAPAPSSAPGIACEIVHDDPGILARSLASDDELLAFLAEAKRPAGLARVEGQLLLIEESLESPAN